jgi:hypothetical protein
MSGQDTLAFSGQTGSFTKSGLGIGSTPAELSIAAPNGAGIDFAIDGYAYHLADSASTAMSATSVQAVSTSCLYLVELDSSGTLTTKKGTEVLTSKLTAGTDVLHWPNPSADKCPIGGFKVALNASTTFTGATTDLDAAGVTDTYYDFIGGIPNAVQTS